MILYSFDILTYKATGTSFVSDADCSLLMGDVERARQRLWRCEPSLASDWKLHHTTCHLLIACVVGFKFRHRGPTSKFRNSPQVPSRRYAVCLTGALRAMRIDEPVTSVSYEPPAVSFLRALHTFCTVPPENHIVAQPNRLPPPKRPESRSLCAGSEGFPTLFSRHAFHGRAVLQAPEGNTCRKASSKRS